MKFSIIFSVFLAALSVGVGASPVPTNELRETPDDSVAPSELAPSEFNNYLQTRNNQLAKTPLYNQLAKTHSNLEVGKWYAFTIKWTEGDAPGDKTPKKEMKEIQKEYGFDHIGIFVAQVKETKKGREKQLDLSG